MTREPPPVNVKVEKPTTIDEAIWSQQAQNWLDLNREANGHEGFYPLTVKAAYVFGVIHDTCESVDWLLKHPQAWPVTYLPAMGLCASGMELLGRCLRGHEGAYRNTADLIEGFEWLRSSSPRSGVPASTITITSYNQYDIARLETLRHFILHGQATVQKGQAVMLDKELLNDFPELIGNAMERYWSQLLNSDDYCERLARASVIALRSDPIKKMWRFFGRSGTSAGSPFHNFDWQI